VVNAFNSLFGYLPGSGFVENDSSTLYLAKPVSLKQGNVTLTVTQVVSDHQNMVVTYEFSGLPQGSAGQPTACVFDSNLVRLPNGKTEQPIGGGIGDSQAHILYQPLPEGVTTLTLLVSQQSPDSACTAPQSWSINLKLGPLPASVTLMPVVQGQDLQVSTQTVAPSVASEAAEIADVHLTIDKVAELADAYVVSGHVTGSNTAWSSVTAWPDAIQISDTSGKAIQIEPDDEDMTDNGEFAFKFAKGEYKSPLIVKFQSVLVSADFVKDNSFSFNAGAQPQVGQTWAVNQTLNLLGHDITVTSVSAIHTNTISKDTLAATGYAIKTKTDLAIQALSFFGTGSQASGDGSFYGDRSQLADGELSQNLNYPAGLPTGKVTYQIRSMQFFLTGPWQLQLQLPASAQ
jgi:hypothetical protein